MDAQNPPALILIVLMAVLISLAIVAMLAIAAVRRWSDGLPIIPGAPVEPRLPARSHARHTFRVRRSPARQRSIPENHGIRQLDATFASSQGSRSGSEGSDSSPSTGEILLTTDEMAYGMLAVSYRAAGIEPTKERAIIRAFPNVSSKGGGHWQRASQVYDQIAAADKRAAAARDSAGKSPIADEVKQ
jgi:hypothetical protein